LCSFDTNLRYIHINDWLAALNGLPVEAHLGRTLREVLPSVAAGVELQLQEVMKTGEPLIDGSVEAETPAQPGVVRTLQHSYYPNRSTDGGIVGVSCVVVEITERKRAEAALTQLSRQHQLILRSAGEGIYGLDLEGRTTFINPAAVQMIGWEVEELLGKARHAILHHSRPDGSPYPGEDCPISTAFKDGAVHHIDTEVFWRKDGTSFPVDYTSTPIRDEQGQLAGAVVTFRDITERKRAEKALRWAHDELELRLKARITERTEARRQIQAGITERRRGEEALRDSEQRLRQLLEDRERLRQDLHGGILQSLYAVGLTLESSKLMGQKSPRQAVQQVDHSIRLLNTVIQEVRDFITGARAQPMDVDQFKSTLAMLVGSLGHTGSLHFQVEVKAAAASRLTDAERFHLLSIAKEALSNSVRHSGGRQGFVSLRRRQDSVRFEVKDDGVGFAVNTLSKSGLGLRNMRERASMIGAHLTVVSKPGRGTRITVDIPRSGLPA
ncbi:MAG: PAS domain-containing protein, partial [Nitrospirales bacterium]